MVTQACVKVFFFFPHNKEKKSNHCSVAFSVRKRWLCSCTRGLVQEVCGFLITRRDVKEATAIWWFCSIWHIFRCIVIDVLRYFCLHLRFVLWKQQITIQYLASGQMYSSPVVLPFPQMDATRVIKLPLNGNSLMTPLNTHWKTDLMTFGVIGWKTDRSVLSTKQVAKDVSQPQSWCGHSDGSYPALMTSTFISCLWSLSGCREACNVWCLVKGSVDLMCDEVGTGWHYGRMRVSRFWTGVHFCIACTEIWNQIFAFVWLSFCFKMDCWNLKDLHFLPERWVTYWIWRTNQTWKRPYFHFLCLIISFTNNELHSPIHCLKFSVRLWNGLYLRTYCMKRFRQTHFLHVMINANSTDKTMNKQWKGTFYLPWEFPLEIICLTRIHSQYHFLLS